MWTSILLLLKNKWVIYGAIALCCVLMLGAVWYRGTYYQCKLEALKIQHQAEKVQLYENFAKEAALHNARLEEIQKTSTDTNKRIKGLKLENEKCQNSDYYAVANSILNRLRQ